MSKNNENDIITGDIEYILIPLEVRNDTRLSANAKLLFGDLLYLSHQKGYCYASNSYLAKRLNATARSVIRWVQELKEIGYITAEYRKDGKFDNVTERRIAISSHIKRATGIPKNVKEYSPKKVVTEMSQGYCQNCHGGSDKNVTQKNKNIRIIDKSSSRRIEPAAAAHEKELEKITEMYQENIEPLKPIVKDSIINWLDKVDADVVIYAIQEAVKYSACNWQYIDTVISSHFQAGRTSMEQINKADKPPHDFNVYNDIMEFTADEIEQIMQEKYDK